MRKLTVIEPVAITSWEHEPLILSAERVAEIYGWTVRGLIRRVSKNRFTQPLSQRPSRWSRADLERDWREGRYRSTRMRRAS
jgi:hypothetical protein